MAPVRLIVKQMSEQQRGLVSSLAMPRSGEITDSRFGEWKIQWLSFSPESDAEDHMRRERALKIVLVIVGLIFVAGVYPMIASIREGWLANKEDSLPMGLSLYVTQGIFLLLAAREPLAYRGVITFAAWLNVAHAAVM